MGWVLSCETGISRVPIFSVLETATSSHAMNGDVWDGPRAVGDPMGVETSFARNLGGLMAPAAATSGPGPVGEARRSQARPQDMRSRTPAWYRGRLEQSRVTSAAETVAGRRSVEGMSVEQGPAFLKAHWPAIRDQLLKGRLPAAAGAPCT